MQALVSVPTYLNLVPSSETLYLCAAPSGRSRGPLHRFSQYSPHNMPPSQTLSSSSPPSTLTSPPVTPISCPAINHPALPPRAVSTHARLSNHPSSIRPPSSAPAPSGIPLSSCCAGARALPPACNSHYSHVFLLVTVNHSSPTPPILRS